MIQVGSLKQKANPYLVAFVFASISVITLLLYIKQEATAKAVELSYSAQFHAENI